jgi:hypothetical protein
MDQNSGKSGIWQSGMALAVDNNRVFFITGYTLLMPILSFMMERKLTSL